VFGFNELSTPIKAIIALGLVLVLVLIAGLLLRRIAGGRLKLPGQGSRARQPRLGIVDIFEMDRQRQLVLLRRDNVEHLVMIGGPNDLVIEASIVRTVGRAQAPAAGEVPDKAAPGLAADAPLEPAPPPRPNRTMMTPALNPAPDTPEAPAPMAAMAGGLAAGAATIAATAALARNAPSPAAIDAPAAPSPEPAKPAPLPPAVSPPAPQAASPAAPAPSQPDIDDQIAASFEAELAKLPPLPAKPILEPIAPPPLAKASAGELDDMTRQLQEALKRPFSGVKPAPVPMAAPAAAAKSEDKPAATLMTSPAPAMVPSPEAPRPDEVLAILREKAKDKSAADMPATVEKPPAAPESSFDFDLERELASALEPVPAPLIVEARTAAPVEPPARLVDAPPIPPALEPAAEAPAETSQVAETLVVTRDEPSQKASQDTARDAGGQTGGQDTTVRPAPEQKAVTDDSATNNAETSVAPAPRAEPDLSPKPEAATKLEVTTKPEVPTKSEVRTETKTAKTEGPATEAKPDAAAADPFSVDAIEAEFARLLNRNAPPKT
jgi:hypothetical protein